MMKTTKHKNTKTLYLCKYLQFILNKNNNNENHKANSFEYIMNGNQKSMTYNKEIVNNANKVHHHITISQIKNECRQFFVLLYFLTCEQ